MAEASADYLINDSIKHGDLTKAKSLNQHDKKLHYRLRHETHERELRDVYIYTAIP